LGHRLCCYWLVKLDQPAAAASGSSYSSAPAPRMGSRRKAQNDVMRSREATRALTPSCVGASIMKRAGRQRAPSREINRDALRASPFLHRNAWARSPSTHPLGSRVIWAAPPRSAFGRSSGGVRGDFGRVR
jgi:hypothetical protein